MAAKPAEDAIDDTSAPLIEHLAELRTRLIWSVLAFVVAMMVCFAFGSQILDFLLKPIESTMRSLGNPNPVMQYTAPQEYFFTLVQISMVGGLMLSFPVIGYQLWRFVAPGLYRSEKNAFLPFLVASPALFLAGAAFAQYVVVPMAMAFFLGFADVPSMVAALFTTQGPVPEPAVTRSGIDIVFNFRSKDLFQSESFQNSLVHVIDGTRIDVLHFSLFQQSNDTHRRTKILTDSNNNNINVI